jgi:hypothetical protein
MNLKFFTVTVAIVATVMTPLASADIVKYSGMCDASAAVPVDASRFIVANDEDNSLRVYKKDASGKASYTSPDLTTFLQIDPKDENPEADIEGAALIGKRIYWISSHGTNDEGDARPNRLRFFATDIKIDGETINLKPVGTPFVDLIKVLENSVDLKDFQLGKAAALATKSKQGLNIEGLTSTPEGALLIGFRSPIPDNKALLIPLENPQAVIEKKAQPKLGTPILLDLGGLGIRSIDYSEAKKAYFIIAGSYDKEHNFQLYQWDGKSPQAELIKDVNFQGLNPEALIVYPEEKTRIQILSDDGEEKLNDKKCKKLKNPLDQSFRSLWINITHSSHNESAGGTSYFG